MRKTSLKLFTALFSICFLIASLSNVVIIGAAGANGSALNGGIVTENLGYYNASTTEYVSNNCDNAANIYPDQSGKESIITIGQVNGVSGMGKALSFLPKASGANHIWAVAKMPIQSSWDMASTKGIAFYAEIPQVSASALQVMLYIDEAHYYNDPLHDQPMYYYQTGATSISSEKIASNNYPFNNKGGFKGWFFLPYGSMQKNGNTMKASDLVNANNFQVRISMITTDTGCYNKQYVFDEFGFYTDPASYVANAMGSHSGTISPEVIANNFDNVANTTSIPDHIAGKVSLSQVEVGNTPYGKAMAYTTGSSGWNNGKISIQMAKPIGYPMYNAEGFAFYAKIPKLANGLDPALHMMLYTGDADGQWWQDPVAGSKVHYLAKGSDTIETTTFNSWADYNIPLHNKSGWEGFVFVPFAAYGLNRDIVDNAATIQIRFNMAKTDSGLANTTIIVDEFGFYKNPKDYAKLALTQDGDMLNSVSKSNSVTTTGGSAAFSVDGLSLTTSGTSFSVTAKNDLVNIDRIKDYKGIMLDVSTPVDMTKGELTFTIKESGQATAETYTLSNGEYFMHCPDEGKGIFQNIGKVSVANFKGKIIIPFTSFKKTAPASGTNGTLEPHKISEITISGTCDKANRAIKLSNITYYSDIEVVALAYGSIGERYKIGPKDSLDRSFTYANGKIRLYDAGSITYEKLLQNIAISPAVFTLTVPTGVKATDTIPAKFTLNILKNGYSIGTVEGELVKDDFVSDEVIVVDPGAPEVADKVVQSTQTVVVGTEIQTIVKDGKTVKLLEIKKAVGDLVQLGQHGVHLNKRMKAKVFLSTFILADGVELSVVDADNNIVSADAEVISGYKLVLKYNGEERVYNILTTAKGASANVNNDDGFNPVPLIIGILIAVIVIAGGVAAFVLFKDPILAFFAKIFKKA